MTIAFVRTLILYIVVIIALRLMGKRQIGELSPSELVVTILISDLAAIPMQDPGISILNGIIPILSLLCLEIIISTILLKSKLSRKILVGSSSILIDNGKINHNEIKRMRITVDELVEELRLKDYPDITCVKYAILETNGKISVIPFPEKDGQSGCVLPITLISDGKLNSSSLSQINKDMTWLNKQIKKGGFSGINDVLLMQYVIEEDRAIFQRKTTDK